MTLSNERMTERRDFKETLFPYDPDEYAKWLCDAQTVSGLVDRCGCLGRGAATYRNQIGMRQNYPEVRFAVHLVENEHFPREGIVYENYTLSYERMCRLRPDTKTAQGSQLLRSSFADRFFKEFDRLYEINRTRIRKTISSMQVDICAVDQGQQRVGFYEVKKYNVGKTGTEVIQPEQVFVLAVVRYVLQLLGDEAFRDGPREVITEIVAFAPEKDLGANRIQARTHTVEFNI